MRKLTLILFSAFLFVCISCEKEDKNISTETPEITLEDTAFTADDWTTETHGKDADANFDEVFDDTQVKRLDIVITAERWQAMLDNMTELYGNFGTSAGGPGLTVTENPVFMPAQVFYKGKEWYRAGIRFKGNSSLESAWGQGNLKLSFKLDFDEFEDTYPQIKNQRFYGFKKLSLKNNFDDKSFLREKVSADIFKKAGLVMSHTAFYTLYVDYGEGPVYFGLYTMVEEVDNTVIKTQYSDDNGNLYKPEDTGASFALGTFNETDFEKKTNEDDSDWADIEALFSVLHDNSRTENPEVWRTELDAIFNTDVFLKYLAVNTLIQNWDTYGRMAHNFYLYNNPEDNRLEWIPWDNNEALQVGKMGGSLALDFSDLNQNEWPLIAFLYNDSVYKAKYESYLTEVIANSFEPEEVKATYAKYADLVEEYAISEQQGYTFLRNTGEFRQAISELNTHADQRKTAFEAYLK